MMLHLQCLALVNRWRRASYKILDLFRCLYILILWYYFLSHQFLQSDVTRNNTRVLIYTGNEKDQESYRMLSANDLPVLDTEDATSSDLRITTIPTSARALDGMRFPEQQP